METNSSVSNNEAYLRPRHYQHHHHQHHPLSPHLLHPHRHQNHLHPNNFRMSKSSQQQQQQQTSSRLRGAYIVKDHFAEQELRPTGASKVRCVGRSVFKTQDGKKAGPRCKILYKDNNNNNNNNSGSNNSNTSSNELKNKIYSNFQHFSETASSIQHPNFIKIERLDRLNRNEYEKQTRKSKRDQIERLIKVSAYIRGLVKFHDALSCGCPKTGYVTFDPDDDDDDYNDGKFKVRAGVYPVDSRKRNDRLRNDLESSCDVYTIVNMSSLARTQVPSGKSVKPCGFVPQTTTPCDQFLQRPYITSKRHFHRLSDTTVWSIGHDGDDEHDNDDDYDDDIDNDDDDDNDDDGKDSHGKQSYPGFGRQISRILKDDKQQTTLLSLSDLSSIGVMPGCTEQDSKSEPEEQGGLRSAFLHSTYSYPLHSTIRYSIMEDVTLG